jgi:hypothetical protein
MNSEHAIHRETAHKLARRALFSFILTFVLARVSVFLIMSGQIPNLYLFLGRTHVHHLNYGIFLHTVGERLGNLMGPGLHDLEAASSP